MLHSCDETEIQGFLRSPHELHKVGDAHSQHVLIHHITASWPANARMVYLAVNALVDIAVTMINSHPLVQTSYVNQLVDVVPVPVR